MNDSLSFDAILQNRDQALRQIAFAREYLMSLLNEVDEALWYSISDGQPSSIAWQIGHLTVAQYGLMLFRQRGRADNDMVLMPSPFRKKFSKGTDPTAITSETYSPDALRQQMQMVHEESIMVCANLSAEQLWEPTDMPYACYPRKLGALMFCPMHEMLHAGQIGLIRRGLGLPPVR